MGLARPPAVSKIILTYCLEYYLKIVISGYFSSNYKWAWQTVTSYNKLLCNLIWFDSFRTVFPSCIIISISLSTWKLQIRKSKDYVYGIWVYKALDIWKGYYRVKKSLVSYVKPWTEARNKYMKYHSKLTYQLSFWNVSRKVDYHAGGKWFIHGPKRRKENQLLSLKHSCWLSLV